MWVGRTSTSRRRTFFAAGLVVIAGFTSVVWVATSGSSPSNSHYSITHFQDWSSISCSNSRDCVVVGSNIENNILTSIFESHRANSWSHLKTVSELPQNAGGEFKSVVCSPTFTCLASGTATIASGGSSNRYVPLFDVFRNGSWSAPSIAAPPTRSMAGISSVGSACSQSGTCWSLYQVIGPHSTSGFVYEESDGVMTSGVSLGQPLSSNHVSVGSISCWVGSSCAVIGEFSVSGKSALFMQTERNGHWLPAVRKTDYVAVNSEDSYTPKSIYCVDASHCFFGGVKGLMSAKPSGFLLQAVNGKWTSINLGDASSTIGVDAISCSSNSSCLAVGNGYVGKRTMSFGIALSESKWGGVHWIAPTSWYRLPTVSCGVTALGCATAVAVSESNNRTSTVVEQVRGLQWIGLGTFSAPNQANFSDLSSISCSGSLCWIAGDISVSDTSLAARIESLKLK